MAILSHWKLIGTGLLVAAFALLFAGYILRGAKIERLEQQLVFIERVNNLQKARADDAAKAMADFRKNARTRKPLEATPEEAAQPVPDVIRRAIDAGMQQVY
jgi:hypothetical protein